MGNANQETVNRSKPSIKNGSKVRVWTDNGWKRGTVTRTMEDSWLVILVEDETLAPADYIRTEVKRGW